jgi:hypothetical protein
MDEDTVRALADAADLELPAERVQLVARQLGVWLAAANELSAKLAAEEHLTVLPIATFTHPGTAGVEA